MDHQPPCSRCSLPKKAIILAGGLGTRLRSIVSDRPKVMAQVAGRPFLEHLVLSLQSFGITHVLFSVGYLRQVIIDYFQDGQAWGLSFDYSIEEAPLGTGGALRQCLPWISHDPVLVLNGDSYCGVNLTDYGSWYHETERVGALVLTKVSHAERFGQVEWTPEYGISGFHEKTSMKGPRWINAGVYLFSPRFIFQIPKGERVSLERDVLPKWVGHGLWGFPSVAPFVDLGTPEGYEDMQKLFSAMPLS